VEIERILCQYPYAEARIESGTDSSIRIQDDEVKVVSGKYSGVSVRVLKNGSWGFASSNNLKELPELLKKADKLASLDKGKIRLAKARPWRTKKGKARGKTDPEVFVRALLEARKEMGGMHVISKRLSCLDSNAKKEFYSSEGAEITQVMGHTYVSCSVAAGIGDKIIRGMETAGTTTGFRAIDVCEIAKVSREKALKLLGAPSAPKGRFTAVFDPEMAGVFAHEALGHASEADSIVDRESILSGKQGKKIGSELISIADDPDTRHFGGYFFDDEGVEAKRTVILDKGVLCGFLNSRETAYETKGKPNGHARAMGFDEVPVVRMSNTFIARGKHPMDEVFEVKHGVYLKGMKGGSVDIFSGGFMFKAEEAYEIKDGELGPALRDAAISGNILSTLRHVEAVGKDFGTSVGMCGKGGQDVPVSDGGPHIRVKNVMVG